MNDRNRRTRTKAQPNISSQSNSKYSMARRRTISARESNSFREAVENDRVYLIADPYPRCRIIGLHYIDKRYADYKIDISTTGMPYGVFTPIPLGLIKRRLIRVPFRVPFLVRFFKERYTQVMREELRRHPISKPKDHPDYIMWRLGR